MKKKLLLFVLMFCVFTTYAQNVGISNANLTPDPSAMLDVYSTTKGILIPRMRTTDRLMINTPAEGLLVYDNTTSSFWYYTSGTWKEIPNTGNTTPMGPALGDLYGTYPAPSVGKIQNLPVAFGVPNDKQVMKWDALNNQWQGLNDSLFLPYNVTSASSTKLFGITNGNTTAASSAIFGRSGTTGSSFVPGFSVGVWGDNNAGFGVFGSSVSGIGVNGASSQNYGVAGASGSVTKAGVYGYGLAGVTGVLGDGSIGGIGIRGNGYSGKAGVFDNTNSANPDTLLKLLQAGTGVGMSLYANNAASAKDGLAVNYAGTGAGISSYAENGIPGLFQIDNANNTNVSLKSFTSGLGRAGSFGISNTANSSNTIEVSTEGTGTAGRFWINNPANTKPVLYSTTNGTGGVAQFFVTNASNSADGLLFTSNGLGRGLHIHLSNPATTNPVIQAVTEGNYGMYLDTRNATSPIGLSSIISTAASNSIAIKGSASANGTNGIGVLGLAGANDNTGIGVKGIAGGGCCNVGIGVLGEAVAANAGSIGIKGTSYSANHTIGSVTGINHSSGAGVYGEAEDYDGIGVVGMVGNTSQPSKAARFENVYNNNTMDVLEVISNGKNTSIFSDNTNLTNTLPIFRVRSAGTGDFLKFETNVAATITRVQKDGDIITAGSVTVRDNKGIVRNSTSTQVMSVLMTASIPSGSLSAYSSGGFNSQATQSVTFTSSFSAVPFVFLGTSTLNSGITVSVENVTTTGCDLVLRNYTSGAQTYNNSTIKILAMGAE